MNIHQLANCWPKAKVHVFPASCAGFLTVFHADLQQLRGTKDPVKGRGPSLVLPGERTEKRDRI